MSLSLLVQLFEHPTIIIRGCMKREWHVEQCYDIDMLPNN